MEEIKPDKESRPVTTRKTQSIEQKMTDDDKRTTQSKLKKREGWVIPGLSESKVIQPRQPYRDKSQVYFSILKPQKEVVTEFKPNGPEENDLPLFKKKWLVNKIIQYEIDGRIFCYRVFASVVDTDDRGQVVTRYGAMASIVYYDEDGDGKFETIDLEDNPAFPRVPPWLEKASA